MVFPPEEHSASCFGFGADSAAIGFTGASTTCASGSSCDWALCAWSAFGTEAACASAATAAGTFQTFESLAGGIARGHARCVRVGEFVEAAIGCQGIVLWPGAIQFLKLRPDGGFASE